MILLDFSNIIVGSIMVAHKIPNEERTSEDFIRHLVLNSVRNYRTKYKAKFGEIVVCTDNMSSWRKVEYKYYKAHRKIKREKQDKEGMDWSALFQTINKNILEIDEFFPYKVVSVPHAEGDDVIAVLAALEREKSIIISSDKDFIQLQKYQEVRQWSPLQKKFIKGDPVESLYDKTSRGESGDGVPNILSSDDTFITEGKRQTPVTKKKMELWRGKKPEEFCNEVMLRNYHRNKTLVDLGETPKSIRINILNQYDNQEAGDRSKLWNYFIDKRLKNLMDVIDEF